MNSRWRALAIGIIVVVVASSMTISLFLVTASWVDVRIPVRSSQPRVALGEAQQLWIRGQYVQALLRYSTAGWMVLDSSIRWVLADIFIGQSETEFQSGQIEDGFESCRNAVVLLGDYDGGATIEEDCWTSYMFFYKQTRVYGNVE